MKDRSYFYYIIAALVLLGSSLIIYQYRSTRINAPAGESTKAQNLGGPTEVQFLKKGEYPSFVSGTMEPGNIRLEMSPEDPDNGQLKVRFFANAHDQLLDPYDMGEMATLEYENRRLKPSYSDRIKGHHGSGLMYFEIGKLEDPAALSTFSITVRGLPKEDVRVFRWK
jgi:hypothetical protein